MTPPAVTDEDLQAFVDGRLDPSRIAEVEAYLAGDPLEREKVESYRQQNQVLHSFFDSILEEPIPRAWQAPMRTRMTWVRPVAAAIAWLFLGGLAGWFLRGESAPQRVASIEFARQAALAHAVYSPEVRHAVEVTAEQEQHLVRWLSKRLGNELKVPHLIDLGYELVGGRLLPGDSGPVAQFMYQESNGKRLTLYVRTDPTSERETAFRYSQQGNVAVFYWLDRRLSYALSGETGKEELLKIANAIYQRLNP